MRDLKEHKIQKKPFDIREELIKILKKCNIEDEEEIEECYKLFQDNRFKKLKHQPDKSQRKLFENLLDQLLIKIQQEKKQLALNLHGKIIKLLKKANIVQQSQVPVCIDYFEKRQFEELQDFPHRPDRKEFNSDLLKLMKDIPVDYHQNNDE